MSVIGEAKQPPTLSPKETKVKMEEVLRSHASYHVLTPDLMQRTFQNFLEELDPSKTYLIEPELTKWTSPSRELLESAIEAYKKESFTAFEEMHGVMLHAIERRRRFEEKLASAPIPKGIQISEFKDLKWAQTEDELYTRLLRIKGLQLESAEKFDPESKSTFGQRLTKRRLSHEEEIAPASAQHRKQVVLCTFLKAAMGALDSQTGYFTPSEANQFMMQVQQRLFGIGALLRDDLTGFTIMRILENSPASLSNKLKVGDRIIAVNRESVIGMDIFEVIGLIQGPQGTSVHLSFLRKTSEGEESFEADIIRGEIVLKETRMESHFEPFGDGAIGILKLFSFYQDEKSSSASDLQQAIQALKTEHNLKGIILDLRNNAGGLLPQAVSVAALFMNKGVVVSVKDNTGMVQRIRNVESKSAVWDGPLIILSNRGTASCSEIVAQTLQEYGRALIVGDPESFGKGTFQTFTLESANYGKVNPKGEYKVTRGRYYTVSGKSPQLVGVASDIVVPGAFHQAELGEKYSKFPLETDKIAPSFEDDLSDVPLIHRAQMNRLYKFNLQPVVTLWQAALPTLKKNSETRQRQNKNYQNFLQAVDKKNLSEDDFPPFGKTDLQLAESLNIMKDFLLMHPHCIL